MITSKSYTVLSYGYWISEADRQGQQGLKDCRLDLGIGYATSGGQIVDKDQIDGFATDIIDGKVEVPTEP